MPLLAFSLSFSSCKRHAAWLVAAATAVGTARGDVEASEIMAAIPGTARRPAAVARAATPPVVAEPQVRPAAGPRPSAGGCNDRACHHGRCKHGGCRHGGCEVPGCPACCPVRPASFGFYDTQWRSWPGHGVAQAGYTEPAAPVMPPKSEVPSAAEESPIPNFEPLAPEPAPDAAGSEPTRDLPPAVLPEPAPKAEEPAPADADAPATPAPAKQPPKAPPAEDNLFDEAALRLRARERLAQLQQAAVRQEQQREQALALQAARLRRPPAGVVQADGAADSQDPAPAEQAAGPAAGGGRDGVTPATHVAPVAREPRPQGPVRRGNPLRAGPRPGESK